MYKKGYRVQEYVTYNNVECRGLEYITYTIMQSAVVRRIPECNTKKKHCPESSNVQDREHIRESDHYQVITG